MFTRRGLALIAFGLALCFVGRLIGAPEFYILGTAAVLLTTVSLVYVNVRRFDIDLARIAIPQRVHMGDQVSIYLRLTNNGRVTSPPLIVRDNVAEWGQARHLAEPIAPQTRLEVHYRVPTTRRGRVRLGPSELAAIDPFGLAVRNQFKIKQTSLLVLPRVVPLVAPPAPGRAEVYGARPQSRSGRDADFALRNYVDGDDARMIHWRSSARRGTLLVREPLESTRATCCIVLDNTHSTTSARFEQMVVLAGSLVVASQQEGFPSQLILTNGHVSSLASTTGEVAQLLDTLAECSINPDQAGQSVPLHTNASAVIITANADAMLRESPLLLTRARESISRILAAFGTSDASYGGTTTVAFNDSSSVATTWNAALGYQNSSSQGRLR